MSISSKINFERKNTTWTYGIIDDTLPAMILPTFGDDMTSKCVYEIREYWSPLKVNSLKDWSCEAHLSKVTFGGVELK